MKKYKNVIIFALLGILNLTAAILLDTPKGLTIINSCVGELLLIAALIEFGIVYYSEKYD